MHSTAVGAQLANTTEHRKRTTSNSQEKSGKMYGEEGDEKENTRMMNRQERIEEVGNG